MQEVQADLGTLNMGEIVRASDIYLAASKSLPDAEAEKWEKAFESMKADGSYQRILQKYRRLKAQPIPDEARKLATDPIWTN
jgi:1,2-phenylacetyl-CoA epoxidase PaaB subunit